MRELEEETTGMTQQDTEIDTDDIESRTNNGDVENENRKTSRETRLKKYPEGTGQNCHNEAKNGEMCSEVVSDMVDGSTRDDTPDVSQPEQEGVDIDTDDNENKAPDGGWGWFVVFGLVLSLCITGNI